MALIGYPPEDTVFLYHFLQKQYAYLEKLKQYSNDRVIIVGYVEFDDSLYNAAAVIFNNQIITYRKIRLPNYDVFDEERYFSKGKEALILRSKDDVRVGLTICEDLWYPDEPILSLCKGKVDVIVNISASPYHYLKPQMRERMFRTRAKDYSVFIVFCNMVGGQDELVFDGYSAVFDPYGEVICRCPGFQEYNSVCDLSLQKIRLSKLNPIRKNLISSCGSSFLDVKVVDLGIDLVGDIDREVLEVHDFCGDEEELFKACVLGTRDYVKKTGFSKVLVAMSGGIDSSLVTCIASEAVGSDNVLGVSMPSMFSSPESVEDAKILANNLGIKHIVIPITDVYNSFLGALDQTYELLGDSSFGVAEENLQSRIRGTIVMTLSNKFGYLVLSCGNKSEASVGYATLYGDLAGGFAPIKDLYKTDVYRVARWYNSKTGVIPERVFVKPPSAELRPNQVDQDTLPPYEVLDKVLRMYIEQGFTPEYISFVLDLDQKFVEGIVRMVEISEYKRRQSPVGVRVSCRAFGKDRRMPIAKFI